MADKMSVLRALKSSPKGQLCYEDKWKKGDIWGSLRRGSLQPVVEEHSPRWSAEEVIAGQEISDLRRVSEGQSELTMKEYSSDDQGSSLYSETDLIRTRVSEAVERGACRSKEGEEVTHSHPQCRVQPEAYYHPREVTMEQEYIQYEEEVSRREERRKEIEMIRRFKQMLDQDRKLNEDRHCEYSDAVEHSRNRQEERKSRRQQLEEKLWIEGESEAEARVQVHQRQRLYANDSLKLMEQEKREHYSRLWSEVYSLLQNHLKAKESAVQACRDVTRLVGARAKVDHLAASVLERVKDAKESLTDEMHQMLLRKVQEVGRAVEDLKVGVDSVNMQVEREEEEKRRRAAEEQQRKEEKERVEAAEKLKAQQPATPPSSVVTGSTASSGEVTHPSVLAEYNRLQERRKNVEKTVEPFVDTKDSNLKVYRFDLQKAVNTPINSISVQSASHIKDKVQRLCNLLDGRPVEVVGKRVSTATHPQAPALDYCRSLFAKKIVGQGEKVVSSHFEAAFPTAAVALGVLSHHPDIVDLLLASFHNTCPILVPLPVPTPPQVTEEEYKRLLGYNMSGNVMEDDDKYMKRMSGVVRLFAAVVQCPTVVWGQRNPLGIENGWKWFALVMNMTPLPGITATAIFDFLEVAGHALMKNYGVQFRKLLRLLISHYLPKIEAVTPPSQKGPVARLKQFLESCIQTGSVPTPKGMLPFEFWKGR